MGPHIVIGIGYCRSTNMQATGIPPHLVTCRKMMELLVVEKVSEICDRINNQGNEQPRLIADYLRKRFQNNGVVPLNNDDLLRMRDSILNEMRELMQNNNLQQQTNRAQQVLDDGAVLEDNEQERYNHWNNWGGRLLQPVPDNFQFVSCNVHTLLL